MTLQVQTWFKAHYENSDDGTTIGDGTGMTVVKFALLIIVTSRLWLPGRMGRTPIKLLAPERCDINTASVSIEFRLKLGFDVSDSLSFKLLLSHLSMRITSIVLNSALEVFLRSAGR